MKKIKKAPKGARHFIALSVSCLLVIIISGKPVIAQPKIPVIKATATTVDIKYGDERRKASWFLDPLAKPDIMYIRQNPDEVKKVTFYTDIDSISFQAKAGQTYSFIVLLNNTERCYTQIAVQSTEGVFKSSGAYIPVLFGILLLTIIGFQKRKVLPTKGLLYLGLITPVLYWLLALTGSLIHGHYNFFTMTVSELGAIGTRSEIFVLSSELMLAVLSTFAIIGFYKAGQESKINMLPILPALSLPVTTVWAALFPLGHAWHAALGPVSLLMSLGTLMASILWRREKRLWPIRLLSIASFMIMSLILLRFVPAFQNSVPGLIQRFFYLGWTVWFVSLSICLPKLIPSKMKIDNVPALKFQKISV